MLAFTCKHGVKIIKICEKCKAENESELQINTMNGLKCKAVQHSDMMVCRTCNFQWDVNDPCPPNCGQTYYVDDIKPIAPNPYASLRRILDEAYKQSTEGKGKERHANDKPFDKQPIMEIARMVGVGGHSYQICKKAQEATSMVKRGNLTAAKAEMLGAIVYAAAAVLLIEEMEQ